MPLTLYTQNSPFLDAIINAELSAISKRAYLERWKVIIQELKRDIYDIITHPDELVPWFKQRFPCDSTLKSYLSAVLAIFRHNPGLMEQHKELRTKWYEAFQEVHARIDERYRHNQPTQKQKDVYVPFSDIIAARNKLDIGSEDKLLLSFYTYLPPLRCDFNHVRIYRGNINESDPTIETNYIHLRPSSIGPSYLILGEFKTQKSFPDYKKELPEELTKELRKSLELEPRNYLFIDRNGRPFHPKSYIQWANRIFARVLGKRMTVSMIRHSFINSLDFNKLTVAEKEQIAKDMAHSVTTQDRYRLIF